MPKKQAKELTGEQTLPGDLKVLSEGQEPDTVQSCKCTANIVKIN